MTIPAKKSFKYVKILLAVGVGVWLPLRVVFFGDLQAADWTLEAVFLLAEGILYLRAKRWPTAMDLAIMLPLVTAAQPWLGPSAKFLMLFKLLFLRQLAGIRDALDTVDTLHPIMARLLPLAVIMPMVVHLVSCGWIFLGSGTSGPQEGMFSEYIKAVYWAITTLCTVGYGDISPKTLPQMGFASVVMIVGVAFFGFVLSNVAALLARMDAAREHHTAILDRVEAFMSFNKVPVDLRTRVRAYYRYLWESRRGYDDSYVLAGLPHKLRSEVSLHMNAEIIAKVPLLKEAEQEFIQEVVLELGSVVTVPEEKIFRHGEPGDAMYFIQKGSVEIISEGGHVLATLTDGAFFGETALLTSNSRNASARAQSYCDLYVLSRARFEKVLNRFPAYRERIHEIARQRQQQASPGKAA